MTRLEGGNFYHVTTLNPDADSTDNEPSAVVVPLLTSLHWMNYEETAGGDVQEWNENPMVFAGGHFKVSVWCTTFGIAERPAFQFTPFFFGLYACDTRDNTGSLPPDPLDQLPEVVPNYFLRNYGTADATYAGLDVKAFPQQRPIRTLFRTHGLIDSGLQNCDHYYDGEELILKPGPLSAWGRHFTVRAKRHLLRRREGLYFVLGARVVTDWGGGMNEHLGLQISGRFGYRRLYTGA